MAMPNYQNEVAAAAAKYPDAWKNAHTGNAQTEDFIRQLAADLHAVDRNVGLNGKRGNPNDLSDDALAVFDPEGDVTDRTGKRMFIIDCIGGAGGPNPQAVWASVGGPSPGAWVQPEAVVVNPGGGTPGEGWTPAHGELLRRLAAIGLATTKPVAEQFAFAFPAEGWGQKRVTDERPVSPDVIARTLNGQMIGYRVVPVTMSPALIPLGGQKFVPVVGVDHLGAGVIGGPPPGPRPSPQPTPQNLPERDEIEDEGRWLSSYYASPEGLQRPQGASLNGAPDWEAVGAWLFDVYLRARLAGKSRADARAAYVAQIRRSQDWGGKHPGETP